MPRAARVKSKDSIYYIMIRSIDGLQLFKDEADIERYIELIRKYQVAFQFQVYAYCFIKNKGQMIIDVNGADITSIMHRINQSYAQYYNSKYERRGHLFADRFKSRIIEEKTDILTFSAYIHRTPLEFSYEGELKAYPYSSFRAYTGLACRYEDLLEKQFLLRLYEESSLNEWGSYKAFVTEYEDINIATMVNFEDEKTVSNSRITDKPTPYDPMEIMEFVSDYTGISAERMMMKHIRSTTESKALSILIMRHFGHVPIETISKVFGGYTQTTISDYCNKGIKLVEENEKYKNIIKTFQKEKV